jgi:uncharacterized protein (TIGR03083 family)
MPELDLTTVTATDGRDLLTAAETDWSRPVPHCPEWDAAGLVGHMGAILAWMDTIVTTGERVARRDRETPPDGHAALASWYSGHLDRTIAVLTTTPADSPAWTFSSLGEQRAGWWRRRLAVELAIHRWDAQHAVGPAAVPPRPVDGDVAVAGIGEFLTEFLPGLLAQPDVTGLAGTLRLSATDGPDAWHVDLGAPSGSVTGAGQSAADTTVHGTRSDLLLWLTNRGPSPSISVSGRAEVADGWSQLCR